MSIAFVALCAAMYLAGSFISSGVDPIQGIYAAMLLAFGATGVVIRRRRPGNPIGPIFLGAAFAAALAEFTHALADRTGSGVLAAYASASWIPLMLPPLTFLLLLFPDGRPLSPRWRKLVWCAAAGMVLERAAVFLRPGPLEDYPEIQNPLGTAAAEPMEALASLLLLVALVGSPISLIRRMRRAVGVERQQLKWLAYAGAFAAAALLIGLALLGAGVPEGPIYVVMMTGVLALPVAAATAIVRYRLYDLDVVVNRALVYVVLTATVAGAYLGSVLLLQLVLPARSDFAVAASTRAAAAVFVPARRRIQAAVDRRFYRRRYDAQRTLDAFGARLRDEIDLDALSGELRLVAADTVQPVHVSLWLAHR